MATIKDIAQKAGVSIGTVDRVLHDRGMVSPETKARIQAVMDELNYKPNRVAQGLAIRKKKLKLVFLTPDDQEHPFYLDIKKAAQKKAEELKQYGVQVIFRELREVLMQHAHSCCDLLSSDEEIDGMVLPGIRGTKASLFIDELDRRQIPYIFYNTLITKDADHLAYVGCNYINAGKLAAGLSALLGGENARVCLYSEGADGIPSHTERIRGFREEAAGRYPDMQILDVRPVSADQIDNFLSAQDMFRTYPDVNIVYVVNPADYGICEAISRADERHQVRIITNDLVAKQIPMIDQGIISATICQEPEKQGELPLEILFRYLAYGTLPKEKLHFTNLSIHIAQNLYS